MKTILLISLAILTTLGTAGAGLYYYRAGMNVPVPSGVVVRDRSDSVFSDCTCTTALARHALRERGLAKGSMLTIIATGDQATADEPVLVADYNVPSTRTAIEGRNATARKQQELLTDLQTKCEQLPMTNRSPIVLSAKRAVERLRAAGCQTGSGCFVVIQSDGEETSEPTVKQLLASQPGSSKTSASSLIDNDGIDIVFYGLSDTKGEELTSGGRRQRVTRTRDASGADRLRAVWLSLFTHRERVSFEPFCPKD